MANIILLFISLFVGILLRHYKILPQDASRVLNQLLIYFFFPALTLLYIPETTFDQRFAIPVLSSWLVYVFSIIFFVSIAKWQQLDKKTVGTLIMTGGIGSTSFVGFPLFELFYGKEGLEIGIVMSMAGTIMACNTIGVATGAWFAATQPSFQKTAISILRFPPFIAFVLALLLNALGYVHSVLIAEVLKKISSPFSIIALLTIGLQIDFSIPKNQQRPLALGLLYKLFLAPLLIFLLFVNLPISKMILELAVLGAAIGSMNMIAVIASQMGLNPPLAANMVGIGIPTSLFTLYLIHLLFSLF